VVRYARPCTFCHVPYPHRMAPFTSMRIVPCRACGRKWVPEALLATIEPPARLPTKGDECLIEVGACVHACVRVCVAAIEPSARLPTKGDECLIGVCVCVCVRAYVRACVCVLVPRNLEEGPTPVMAWRQRLRKSGDWRLSAIFVPAVCVRRRGSAGSAHAAPARQTPFACRR
jgi:hypothetical protein